MHRAVVTAFAGQCRAPLLLFFVRAADPVRICAGDRGSNTRPPYEESYHSPQEHYRACMLSFLIKDASFQLVLSRSSGIYLSPFVWKHTYYVTVGRPHPRAITHTLTDLPTQSSIGSVRTVLGYFRIQHPVVPYGTKGIAGFRTLADSMICGPLTTLRWVPREPATMDGSYPALSEGFRAKWVGLCSSTLISRGTSHT